MTTDLEKEDDGRKDARHELDLRSLAFPSDAITVKRLRATFPERFDGEGFIRDGYSGCNFFYPSNIDEPENLMRLTSLLCDERVVAASGFYRQFRDEIPEAFGSEETEIVAESEATLVDSYLYFRLADSPETARLLVEQVRAEGEKQALAKRSRAR